MIRLLASFTCLAMFSWAAAEAAAPVYIANGDCVSLQAALAKGTQVEPASIVLARGGGYACNLDVAGAAVVEGSGATLVPAQCLSVSFGVRKSAQLTLRNLSLEQSSCRALSEFVVNSGNLELEAVTVDANSGSGGRAVSNDQGAALTLRNVTGFGSLLNRGTVNAFNSTWVGTQILADAGSQFLFSNSIVAKGLSAAGCPVQGSGAVRSLGGNVLDGACAWKTAADVQSADTGVAIAPAANGGLVRTLALSASSGARGKGVAAYCLATDARGETRAIGRCDAGAYEFDGGRRAIGAGGENGVYFDSQADGHYVSLQRIDDTHVLVYWTTFDRKGNPAWIYGVGALSGKHIHAAMSQNLGGHLQPGGPASGALARMWGSVDIDLTNCASAQFQYSSALSEFGSGQFPLNRLAETYDFGCAD